MHLARNNSNGRKYSCVLPALIVIVTPHTISGTGALPTNKINGDMKDNIMLSTMRKVITHRTAGMEYQNQTQPYQVLAFGESGQRVFASYN